MVATAKRSEALDTTEREIVTTRTFDAPRDLVFKAWTDPKHVAEWWGPNGFTNTIIEMNVRPGGVWRFIMHGPDGTDYPNRTVFHEVVEPERLVYTHDSDIDDDPDGFHVTVTFEARGHKTIVTMRALLKSVEACVKAKAFGAVEGGKQTLERFAEYVTRAQASGLGPQA